MVAITKALSRIVFRQSRHTNARCSGRGNVEREGVESRFINLKGGIENGYPVAIYSKPIVYDLF